MDLNQFQYRVLSQFGQDGVLEAIFNAIGTTNRYFVEFGSSGNDSGMGNTAYMRRRGFDGLLMDGSERPYQNDVTDRRYDVKIEFITPSNINQLFKKYDVPAEFDFLSIDIDGQDFHVWNRLDGYSPRVVSIEMCYHIAPGNDKVLKLNDEWMWDGNCPSGSSMTALKKLGNKKGYSLVALCVSDAIFVRNDLLVDNQGNALFKNVNNEFELAQLNKELAVENNRFNISQFYFNHPLFTSSDAYLS